jgi:hypothetical protein
LSLAYSLKFTGAGQIESYLKLAKLEVEELPDQDVDLGRLENLQWLAITASRRWRNFSQLEQLAMLQISKFSKVDFSEDGLSRNIRRLEIYGSPSLQSLKGIAAAQGLSYLKLFGLTKLASLDSIGSLTDITHLVIERCRSLENIDIVSLLPRLKYLEIRDCPKLKDVATFPDSSSLSHVFFTGSTRLSAQVATVIERLPHLKFYFATH